MIRALFVLAFTISLDACATNLARPETRNQDQLAEENESREVAAKSMTDAWAEQQTCWNAWAMLLQEWRANGGGMKDSIVATRGQIAADKKSKFAQIVREVWASQKMTRADPSVPIGAGSISDDAFRGVFENSDSAAKSVQPAECQTFIWIGDLLREELLKTENGKLIVRRLEETPASMKPYGPAIWLTY
jgi:hypothetical protein